MKLKLKLKDDIEIGTMLGQSPRSVIQSRMSLPDKGKGSRAKRKAGQLVWEQVKTNRFTVDFDRLNVFSGGVIV